jgi:hypothetical protein
VQVVWHDDKGQGVGLFQVLRLFQTPNDAPGRLEWCQQRLAFAGDGGAQIADLVSC